MQFGSIDLNLLRALDALLQEQNVTRAAGRLHVTQQAMSGSLRRLREQFGDELLVRHGRQSELTPLGMALRDPIREAILQVQRAVETRPTFDPALANRRFRLAVSDYVTMTYLPHVMAELASAPGISFDIDLIHENTFPDLEAGRLDFCVLPSSYTELFGRHPPGLRKRHLFCEDWVCVVDRDNPGVGKTLSMTQYLELPHNLAHFGDTGNSMVEAAWAASKLSPRVVARTPSFTSQVSMVVGSSHIATTQRRLAAIFVKALPIRILECPIAVDELQEDLYWHKRHDGDPAHGWVRKVFQQAAQAMA